MTGRHAAATRTSLRVCAAAIAFAMIAMVVSSPARAQYWPQDAVFPEDPVKVIFTSDYDLLVGIVQNVDDSLATQGNPPRLTIRVQEVLFGSPRSGTINARWLPWEPWIPCAVGEEGNIRRWNATPMKGPAIGTRMILAGSINSEGWLEVKPKFHWTYSKRSRDHWAHLVKTWEPRVERRRQLQARQRREEARTAREAAIRQEYVLRKREQEWFADQSRIVATADFDELVQASTDIVIGDLECRPGARSGWEPVFRVDHWLRSSKQEGESSRPIHLYFGQREDSLRSRWSDRPLDLEPGSGRGDRLLCIAFLRFAHDSLYFARTPIYRPVDCRSGLLLANARTQQAAEAALVHSSSGDVQLDCEASLAEFIGLDSTAAASVGIKLSSTPPHKSWSFHWFPRELSMVLACPPGGDGLITSVNASWFAPCRLPSERYVQDFQEAGTNIVVSAPEMKALLDSLGELASFREKRFASDDSVTLMVRRIRSGQERVYETTLDQAMFHDLVELLAGIFVGAREPIRPNHGTGPDSARRANIAGWTTTLDKSCESIWLAHPEKYTLFGP